MTDVDMPFEPHDLLPGASTPLQVTMSLVDAGRAYILSGFPTLGTLLDPATCPALMLPYLAYQRSVATWDSAWPEQVKRDVIGAAYEVHRHKGTVAAVKTALRALGIVAHVTEWWQTSPRGFPYTFEVETYAGVELYSGDTIITARMARAIRSAINAVKPLTRTFIFDVGALSNASLAMAGGWSAVRMPLFDFDWITPEADSRAGLIGALAVTRSVTFTGA